jgi:hypothetical protein
MTRPLAWLSACGWQCGRLVLVAHPESTGICAACAELLRAEARALLTRRRREAA